MDHCVTCNKSMKKGNMRFHLKSKSHLQNINKNDESVQEMDESEKRDFEVLHLFDYLMYQIV